jgi:hypothetical protein
MTHSDLVEIGYKWVLKGRGCGVAFKELKSYAKEIPDVIGFGNGASIIIECKASRADFLQDKNKEHRKKGMGVFRYYLCPEGMISTDELPDKWGLIYVSQSGKTKCVKDPRKSFTSIGSNGYSDVDYWTAHYRDAFSADVQEENKIMYTALRRLFIKGFMHHIYDKDYSGKQLNQQP